MLRHEFEGLTGLTSKAINDKMYDSIEKIYMQNESESKGDFCGRFYSLYKQTVNKVIEDTIHKAPLEDKIEVAEGYRNKLWDLCDAIREQKTWQLINLLTLPEQQSA